MRICSREFNFRTTLLCVKDFSPKIVIHRAANEKIDWGSRSSRNGSLKSWHDFLSFSRIIR